MLAMKKFQWRNPENRLTGETPDTSAFKHHVWEKIENCDPLVK